MSRRKAAVASIIIMALFGGVLLCFRIWQNQLYYVFIHIVALYGFITGGFHFYNWFKCEDVQDADYTSLDVTNDI